MKAVYIYPSDIGCGDEWTENWVKFITKFGYTDGTPWGCVLVCPIQLTN